MTSLEDLGLKLAEKGFTAGRCSFCGSHRGFAQVSDNDSVHPGLQVYHDEKSYHIGVVILSCSGCGHIELFNESMLFKFANFNQEKEKIESDVQ